MGPTARSFRHCSIACPARLTAYGLLLTAYCFLVSCARQEPSFHERERNRIFAEILKREDQRSFGPDDFLKDHLEGSPYPEIRQWCAIALGRIGDPRALPWLYAAFRSNYKDVRAAAAFAVGEIEDREMLKEQSRQPDGRAVPAACRIAGGSGGSSAHARRRGDRESSARCVCGRDCGADAEILRMMAHPMSKLTWRWLSPR